MSGALAQNLMTPRVNSGVRFAEAGIPFLQNFTPKEYGADAQNWAIVQDRRGVMYFGNNTGVLEYDGVSWRMIPVDNGSAVRSLAVDERGVVYVGAQGEIGYLTPDSIGQMKYASLRAQIPEAYRDFADIAKTYATGAGIYFQALDRLFLWRSGRMRVWEPETPFHLSFVVHGCFYIRQPGLGLLQMIEDSLQLAPGGEKFADARIYFMLPYEEDKVLIGVRELGLFLYDGVRAAGSFSTQLDEFLIENQIYHGAILPEDALALATDRGGVAILTREGKGQLVLNKAMGLQDEDVNYVFPDRQGGLWLALNNGITRVETPAPLSRYDEHNNLNGAVESVRRHQGVLYAATSQGLYYLQTRAFQAAGSSFIQPPKFEAIPGITLKSWFLLSHGQDLFTACSDGVYLIQGKKSHQVRASQGHSFVLCPSTFDTNRVYLGLLNGLACLYFDERSGQWRDGGQVNGITDEIRSIVETKEGLLWLGTRSQGYIRVDFSDGFHRDPQLERFGAQHGLPEDHGWVTVLARADHALFATEKGLFRFDQQAKRFFPDTSLGRDYSGGSRLIGETAVGAPGTLWMQSTAGGINEIVMVRRNADSYVWERAPFNHLANFNVWEIHPETDGVTWFGGPDGLIRYDEGVEKKYTADFAALIRRVSTVDPSSLIFGGAGISKLPFVSPRLAYANNALRFEFAAASYDAQAANQFQYWLEGFDDNWSEWTRETKKEYTNLSEGEYHFHVRAKNIYGHPGAEAAYSFGISPPWYRAWWAYLFYAGAIALTIHSFIRNRTRQLVQRSHALERVVQQRTEEIRQQAVELETLDGIVKNINREVDLGDVLRSLLEQGLKLFPQAEKASMLLLNHGSGLFKFAAAAGYDLNLMQDISFTPAQLAQRYSAGSEQVGEGVYIMRNLQSLYVEKKLNAVSTPISVLAMTAVREGRVEAYLIFDNLSNPDAFSHSDARKLNRFRSHAISAIAKAIILQELQEKNAEILRTQQQLVMQEKLASLGALTAGIAHEIKNPLNFINNFAVLSVELAQELQAEIAQQQGKLEAAAEASIADLLRMLQQNAEKINEHGRRADSIVRGMLQHSRTQAGERERTELNSLLQQAVHLSYHGMRAQENGFNVSIQEEYDASVGEIAVIPQELSRVFLNLINNAGYAAHEKAKRKREAGESGRREERVKAAVGGREGGIPAESAEVKPGFMPTINVRTKNLGDTIEICIRDNGTGIPAAVLDKIFNPFFTTKPTGQGTGLGLSISYDIIQKHGGKISVDTEEGSYTEFVITLPKNGK